ncbi:MAG TPA: hypothetical protein VFM32_01500 [Spongiibacteraceae bacterium]|nr:hypothetical protein [Spongiibacteraceae bacterium]
MSAVVTVCFGKYQARWQSLSVLRYVLSGLLLSAVSARAQAPALSQEFWNYLAEFGDAQGELFDPSDYAAVANIPAKAQQQIDDAATAARPRQVSQESHATQEQSK